MRLGSLRDMRAVQFAETGDPDVLHVTDVPEPHAGAGHIRIEVKAAAVNPVDWKFRRGMMDADLPHTPGFDVAGIVDEVGDGVEGVSEGDAVSARP